MRHGRVKILLHCNYTACDGYSNENAFLSGKSDSIWTDLKVKMQSKFRYSTLAFLVCSWISCFKAEEGNIYVTFWKQFRAIFSNTN